MAEDKKINHANDLRTIVNSKEWESIENIFLRIYTDAWYTLSEKEDNKARGTLNAIEEIYSKITSGLKLGDIAMREKLSKIKGETK